MLQGVGEDPALDPKERTKMNKTHLKALAIIAGNVVGANVGHEFSRKTFEALKAGGLVTGGDTDEEPIDLTEEGNAALREAL